MNIDRTLTTGYLLRLTAAFAILVAITGCDSGQDRNEMSQPASDLESTGESAGETRPYGADSDYTDRDQSVAGVSGDSETNAQYSREESAVAQIRPTSTGNVEGRVTFSAGENNQEMRVTVELNGLEPGLHGFHVHEVGDCSADDASSAGGHFNPYDAAHGAPDAAEHHVGDMGNIEADENGQVSSEMSFQGLTLFGPESILQKAVVVHSNADDFESQPSGDAGDRIGCGVIQSGRD